MESFAYLIEKQSILKGIRYSKNTKKINNGIETNMPQKIIKIVKKKYKACQIVWKVPEKDNATSNCNQ